MDVGVADVRHFQAGGFDPLLESGERLVSAAGGAHGDVFDAHLFGERQIFVGEIRPDLKRDLDAGREGLQRAVWRHEQDSSNCGCAETR